MGRTLPTYNMLILQELDKDEWKRFRRALRRRFGTEIPECGQRVELAVGVPRFKPLYRSPVRAEKETPSPRIRVAEGGQRGRAEGRNLQAGKPAHVSALFCDPPAGGRVRHPDDPRVARPSGCEHDHDLHARVEPGRTGGQ